MNHHFYDIVKTKDKDIQTFFFAFYVQKIFEKHPSDILAILAYGSFLNDSTKSKTSTPDFYVVVDNYRQFYQSSLHSFLNKHLPPNIYHLRSGQTSYKYCVISIKDLQREVSEKAKDVYHLGRFSKRMGLVWVKDEDTEKKIVQIQMAAIRIVSKKVIQSIQGHFTLDEFIQHALFLSYMGDVRIESSDKVEKIMGAEKKYYEAIFHEALKDLGVSKNASDEYMIQKSFLKKSWDKLRFKKFISASKLRAQGRWPKNMMTVDNWLDYMLAKIERTKGIKIELSPKERKYWFIYGWKHFFRLSRSKLIK